MREQRTSMNQIKNLQLIYVFICHRHIFQFHINNFMHENERDSKIYRENNNKNKANIKTATYASFTATTTHKNKEFQYTIHTWDMQYVHLAFLLFASTRKMGSLRLTEYYWHFVKANKVILHIRNNGYFLETEKKNLK